MLRDNEVLEGIKDAGVDLKNKLPMRELSKYNDPYREGYLSKYKKATKKKIGGK